MLLRFVPELRAYGAYFEDPVRVGVCTVQTCPHHFVVWCVRLHVGFSLDVSPGKSPGKPRYLLFLLGLQPFCKPVRVREGAFPFASACKVADAFVGVSAAFVAPYPWLLCVASHLYAVPSSLFGWDLIFVVSRFPFLPVVRVDGVKWCISCVCQCQRLIHASAVNASSLANFSSSLDMLRLQLDKGTCP